MPPNFPLQVLISPLDWGLGHATRCIPIIKTLKARGVTVIIATGGAQMALLQAEFPELEFVRIPGYGVRYSSKSGGLVPGLLFRIPGLLRSIRRENAWLEKFCSNRRIDAVISDNRYGFYHRKIFSVFITHQLFIQSGLGNLVNRLLLRWNYFFIQRFSECWVPDFENWYSLAGILSHPPRFPAIPVKYAGILSRFQPGGKEIRNPLLILISGPEPQRTEFENKILSELSLYKGSAVLMRGLPGREEKKMISNERIEIYNHLASGPLNDLMNISEAVICRSGYSTLMDLARLHKKAVLIPTPGQPEQEWLGAYLHEKKWALQIQQKVFNLDSCLKIISETGFGFPEFPDELFPENLIDGFLNQLNSFHPSGYRRK